MAVRLTDIAARAGVSTATVSRVLNSKPGVSSAVREAVLAAIDAMGYVRPALLAPRPANLVGLVLPDLEDPFNARIAQTITGVLSQHGVTAVLCTSTQRIESLVDIGVAGVIVISGDDDHYAGLHRRGVPFTSINGITPDLRAPTFSTDGVSAADQAVAHLVALGHQRVGLVVGSDAMGRLMQGFTKSIARLTATPPLIERAPCTLEGGHAGGERLLAQGVTAIVAGSDLLALGVIRAARMRGMHIPRDLSVVGCDDAPFVAFTDPPLTTVRQQVMEISQAAVAALLDQVRGRPTEPAEYLFEPELVARGSTGPAPGAVDARVIPIEGARR